MRKSYSQDRPLPATCVPWQDLLHSVSEPQTKFIFLPLSHWCQKFCHSEEEVEHHPSLITSLLVLCMCPGFSSTSSTKALTKWKQGFFFLYYHCFELGEHVRNNCFATFEDLCSCTAFGCPRRTKVPCDFRVRDCADYLDGENMRHSPRWMLCSQVLP